ncbi:MAG: UDP-N-acetylmuramate dehydrogenase [Acidobacteriota bacterium]
MATDPALGVALAGILGLGSVRANVPLATLTTFRVGGPADYLVDVESSAQLERVLSLARRHEAPVTVLGGGSNLLVADAGVRGVVVRLRLMDISQPLPDAVRAGAGVTMNGLVRWTIGRGCVGLEAWAGTPGTVGGAIYGNAHYAGRNIGDRVVRAQLMTPEGRTVIVPASEMGFAYDASRLQQTRELLTWADFRVATGDPEALRSVARASLSHRKRSQPLGVPSAGCVFQNPDPRRDRVPDGIPASAGALVDRAGLKGHRIGGAVVSMVHANFIVNDRHATAAEIYALIELVRDEVCERFGVALRDEVVRIGEF